jgi:hypothetical protein
LEFLRLLTLGVLIFVLPLAIFVQARLVLAPWGLFWVGLVATLAVAGIGLWTIETIRAGVARDARRAALAVARRQVATRKASARLKPQPPPTRSADGQPLGREDAWASRLAVAQERLARGDAGGAIHALEDLLTVAPDYAPAHAALADAHRARGDEGKAVDALTRAFELRARQLTGQGDDAPI